MTPDAEAASISTIDPGAAEAEAGATANGASSRGVTFSPDGIVKTLTAPIGIIVATVGGLAATGVLGRVERNEAGLFQASLMLVMLGCAILLVSGSLRQACPEPRPKPKRLPARFCAYVHRALLAGGFAVGTLCAAAGIVLAVGVAVATASQTERPMIMLSVDPANLDVAATVRVSNVPSDRRMVLVVDGLEPSEDGETYEPTTVYQAYVGPDGDGKIDLPVKLRLQRKFSAVGVKAYVSRPHKDAGTVGQICTPYPRRVSTFAEARGDVGPGCVIVALPE